MVYYRRKIIEMADRYEMPLTELCDSVDELEQKVLAHFGENGVAI